MTQVDPFQVGRPAYDRRRGERPKPIYEADAQCQSEDSGCVHFFNLLPRRGRKPGARASTTMLPVWGSRRGVASADLLGISPERRSLSALRAGRAAGNVQSRAAPLGQESYSTDTPFQNAT